MVTFWRMTGAVALTCPNMESAIERVLPTPVHAHHSAALSAKVRRRVRAYHPAHRPHLSPRMADLIQQAGALAVCECGGPEVEMKYGRVDVTDKFLLEDNVPVTFGLPPPESFKTEEYPEDAKIDGLYEFEAEAHLRKVRCLYRAERRSTWL